MGRQSSTDAERVEEFSVADIDWITLRQVQDALKRIKDVPCLDLLLDKPIPLTRRAPYRGGLPGSL